MIVPLSNQAAFGPENFCREALHRVDVVSHLVHTEVAAPAGVAGEGDCKSVTVNHCPSDTNTCAQPEAAMSFKCKRTPCPSISQG